MKAEYVADGKVRRNAISFDIARGTLTGDDLDDLIADPQIAASFRGTGFDERPQNEWTEDYLSKLALASIAEFFNADYLRYLDRVAQYVAAERRNEALKKRQRRRRIVTAILIVAAIAVIIWIVATMWRS